MRASPDTTRAVFVIGPGEVLAGVTTASIDHPHQHRLKATWPLHKRQAVELLAGWAGIVAVWILFGKLLAGPLDNSALTRADERIERWMAARRTPTWNRLTLIGEYLAETVTKIAVTAILALVLLKVWKRWLEPLLLVLSLALEAAAFIVITKVVDRPRPSVPRLDGSPVGSSFPSGHVAAAMAYFAIVVIIFWHTRKVWARVLSVAIASVTPVIVGLSRMYRGMHFLTDVVAGAIIGAMAVALTVMVLRHTDEARAELSRASASAPTRVDDPRP